MENPKSDSAEQVQFCNLLLYKYLLFYRVWKTRKMTQLKVGKLLLYKLLTVFQFV